MHKVGAGSDGEAGIHPAAATGGKGLGADDAGGITVQGRPTCLTKVPSEGTNPCTQSIFATKNVFDVLQDLSESI